MNKQAKIRKLRNELIDKQKLGWSPNTVEAMEKKFVNILTDTLWCIDGHGKTLMSHNTAIPSLFSRFSGFNKRESHGQEKSLETTTTKLLTFSKNFFSISEEPWLS